MLLELKSLATCSKTTGPNQVTQIIYQAHSHETTNVAQEKACDDDTSGIV